MMLHWGSEYLEKVLPPHLLAHVKDTRCDPHLDTKAHVRHIPMSMLIVAK